jgi:hypothetical protein
MLYVTLPSERGPDLRFSQRLPCTFVFWYMTPYSLVLKVSEMSTMVMEVVVSAETSIHSTRQHEVILQKRALFKDYDFWLARVFH